MGAPKDSAIELQSRGGQTAGDASPSASVSTDAASGAGAGTGAVASTRSSMVDASREVCVAAETAAIFTDVPLLDSPAAAQSSSGGGVAAAVDSAAAEQQGEPWVSSAFKVQTTWQGRKQVHMFTGNARQSVHARGMPACAAHGVRWGFRRCIQRFRLCCLHLPFSVQFVPKPPPIMAPTRHNLLAPPAAANGTAGATLNGSAGSAAAPAAAPAGKLTKAEERAVGQVDRAVYLEYFR